MEIPEIIKQVLYNPQVSYPPISYRIKDTEYDGQGYESEYIDIKDFKRYLKRLEQQLNFRLKK